MYWLIPLALAAAAAQAAQLTLQSPKFSILSSNASQIRAEPISLAKKPTKPVVLSPTDTLKLAFQVVDKEKGEGVRPHQTFLRFYDARTKEEGIQPVRVSTTGKGKFELNMARPPNSIPPTTATALQVSLIIGSFVHDPLKVDLFDLQLPPSQPGPVHPDEASFHPRPEIKHTFRPEQKVPPKSISMIFTVVVLSPWVVLLSLWGSISPSVPRLYSTKIAPFTATLATFEFLLFRYWVGLKLGEVLTYGAVLAVVALFTGKIALSSIGVQRLGRV